MTDPLYDPLDLDTQPTRKRKPANPEFNQLRRTPRTFEQQRVVRQPVSPEWMLKPLRPGSELFKRKGSP